MTKKEGITRRKKKIILTKRKPKNYKKESKFTKTKIMSELATHKQVLKRRFK